MTTELPYGSYSAGPINNEIVTIGRYSSIAGGFRPHKDDNHPWVGDRKVVSNYPFKERWNADYPKSDNGVGKVSIGSDCWLCEDVVMLSGTSVGDGAIVGAATVVAKDVPPYAVFIGNPGRVVKYRFTQKQIDVLLKVRWWDWTEEAIRENMELLSDINKFMEKYG